MPYFKWHGFDTAGGMRQGSLFARSPELLAQQLQAQQVTLVAATRQSAPSFAFASYQQRAVFFQQIGSLLKAGVTVIDALAVAETTITHTYFRLVIADCRQAVEEGSSLSEACSYHADFFTPFACRLLVAGEESGSLPDVCLHVASHYASLDAFTKQVRAALVIPLLTFGFFIVVVGLLCFVVVPRFANVLHSLNKPLPWRTELVISLSLWIQQHALLCCALAAALVFMVVRALLRRMQQHTMLGGWVLHLPLVRWWVIFATQASFFRTVGSLLVGGVDIAHALSLATLGVTCAPLQAAYAAVATDVEQGTAFAQALAQNNVYVPAVCQSLLAIGENTGTLGTMLLRSAEYCQEQLYRRLQRFSAVIQPAVLVFLGVLVAVLIFSLYEPLFTLSSCIE